MNCPNCHRAMLMNGILWDCRFCGVQGFANPRESALVSVAWLDQAPYFRPIGPIGANTPFAAPRPVMKFPTTSSEATVVNPDLRP